MSSPAGSHPVAQALPPINRYRQVRAFTQLVDQHLRTLKSVQAYADQLRITPNHLHALCRRLLPQTASEVLHDRIVAEAQHLLTQLSASVAAIATALGFNDASYFARYFKKCVGQTPLVFRQNRWPPSLTRTILAGLGAAR